MALRIYRSTLYNAFVDYMGRVYSPISCMIYIATSLQIGATTYIIAMFWYIFSDFVNQYEFNNTFDDEIPDTFIMTNDLL